AGGTAASAQSIRAQAAQARQMLPQIRQGIAAAEQDRGSVPGLSRYFSQMESVIGSALQAVDACLASPERCNPPQFSCPAPPNIAVYGKQNASTALIRNVQESYRQSANMAQQACLNLKMAVSRDIERLKKEGRGGGAQEAAGSAGAQRFGETDLYLARAGNLKREAAQLRLDADRASGVGSYCNVRPNAAAGSRDTGTLIKAVKAAGARAGKDDAGIPIDGKVADLKADWGAKWSKGTMLGSPVGPLPESAPGGVTVSDRFKEYLSEKSPWWWNKWYKVKAAYRDADEAVGLTEFIKSRPVELAKDAATEFLEWRFGKHGKSVTTGLKIQGAVKSTGDEVGEIIVAAPQVIVHGGGADARKLYDRADRVPLKLSNDLFDDVTGKFPMSPQETGVRDGGRQ
ncbi:MAG: hypothetical protein H6Q84_3477, partial [Deltaproteobacteria bacterium]|nr:hypothetical protein [Deltaproteobacteria bacterium]